MDEQQLQEQIVLLVQAGALGDKLANALVAQIIMAAQQNDSDAVQMLQAIQEIAVQTLGQQLAQAWFKSITDLMKAGQVQAAKFGAKLNYFKQLRGQCPDGYEMKMFRAGGRVCKKCMKKREQGGEVPQAKCGTAVEQFKAHKCGGKAKKKVSKHEGGTGEKGIRPLYTPEHRYLLRGNGLWSTNYYTDDKTPILLTTINMDNGEGFELYLEGSGSPDIYGDYSLPVVNLRYTPNEMDAITTRYKLADALRPAPIDTSIIGAPSSKPKIKKKR